MLLLDATFGVKPEVSRDDVFNMAQRYVNDVASLDVPQPELGQDEEARTDDGLTSVWVGNYDDAFAFVVTEDSEDGSRRTSAILRDKDENPSMHFQQEWRAKSLMLVADDDNLWPVPQVLHEIFWNDLGADDGEIPFTNTPIPVTKANVGLLAQMFIAEDESSPKAPVVCVMKDVINCERAAEELAGQAHVLYIANPVAEGELRRALKEDGSEDRMPGSDNAIIVIPNGDVCVSVFPADMGGLREARTNYIIGKVRQAIFSFGVPDVYNISALQYSHLRGKSGGDSELTELFDRMLAEADAEKSALERELASVREQLRQSVAKSDSLARGLEKTEQQKGGKFITLDVTESDLYDGEMKDVILKALSQVRGTMMGDSTLKVSRKYHVLSDVLEHNFPCGTDAELTECVRGAFTDGTLTRDGIGRLRAAGFTVEKEQRNGHYKIRLSSDDRYLGIYAATPSDKGRSVDNFISDFTNLLFGY